MADGHLNDILAWIAEAAACNSLTLEPMPLSALDRWRLQGSPLHLAHDSGAFFSIRGMRVTTDYGTIRRWDQPMIDQPEVGILGILTRLSGGQRHYLMQAKVEPGNRNGPQISPTLQATPSNYLRVHLGRAPYYLDWFTGARFARVIVDQLQSEQAARFIGKRNRNMLIEVDEAVPCLPGFRWMSLDDIKRLYHVDDLINMDTRSVLSCLPLRMLHKANSEPCHPFTKSLAVSVDRAAWCANALPAVVEWLARLGTGYHRGLEERGLDRLEEWVLSDEGIRHRDGRYFSVTGVRVSIPRREVESWSQPLVRPAGPGLIGLVVQEIEGVLHLLFHAEFRPGSRKLFELGPSISKSNFADETGRPEPHPLTGLFRDPPDGSVRFSVLLSDEGGRFLDAQNRHTILETTVLDLPSDAFVWLALHQVEQLIPDGYFNIEARSIISCVTLMQDDQAE